LADAGACRGRNTLLHRWVVSPFPHVSLSCPTPRATPLQHPSAGNPGEFLSIFMLGDVFFACSLSHCASRARCRQQPARGSSDSLEPPNSCAQARLPVSDGPPWSKKCLAQRKESLSRPTIERKYLRVLTNILCDNPTTCSSSTPPQTGLGCLSNSQMLSSRARTIERHPQLSAQEALRLLRSMSPLPPHFFFNSLSPTTPTHPHHL
jgi:hypothetical protein